jgi:sugar phosphate isomerase/epimerase
MEMSKPGLSRRSVLGVAAGTGAAALVAGPLATPAAAVGGQHGRLVPRGRLGIQTFTVRDKVGELGYAALFEALASYGYDEIELFGGFDAAEVRQLLDDNGLRGIGRHVGYTSFLDDLEQVLDDAETLGLPYIGTANNPGRYGNTVDGYRQAAEDFNTFGAAAKARGMKWYQHNHDGEFAFAEDDPTVRLYDVLLAETDPDLVFLQLDVHWAYVGQYLYSSRRDAEGNLIPVPFEPLDYVLAQPERYPLFHIKDGVYDTESSRGGYSFTDVGEGSHNLAGFIDKVESSRSHRRGRRGPGYHHYIVERDDAPNLEPNPPGSLGTAERGAAYLLSLREGAGGC